MNLVICRPSLSAERVPFGKVLAREAGAGVEGRALLQRMAAKLPLLDKRKSMEKAILRRSCKNGRALVCMQVARCLLGKDAKPAKVTQARASVAHDRTTTSSSA